MIVKNHSQENVIVEFSSQLCNNPIFCYNKKNKRTKIEILANV